MAEKSITVSFQEGAAANLFLELDSEKNDDKTSFTTDDIIYLKFSSSSNDSYTITTSSGSARVVGSDIHYPISDEEVQFANADQGTLDRLPVGSVDYEWVGRSGGTSLFSDRIVTINSIKTAILNCNYETKGDRIALTPTESGNILVVVIQGDNQVSTTVSVTDPADPVAYQLEVKDFCSDYVLANVAVSLDGISKGVTDENGLIDLGLLIPGSVHTVKMTKTGYTDSDDDPLSNDSFTVIA